MPKPIPPPPVNLTVPQAAARIKRSEKTLFTWRISGIGPRWIRQGKRVYYPEPDLLRWLEHGDPR